MDRGVLNIRTGEQAIRVACRCLALLAFILAFGALSVCAQEHAPKSFYKKDYASAPGAEGRTEPIETPQRRPTQVVTNSASTSPTTSSPKEKATESRKRRVVISVYVNSQDREHLHRVLAEVYQLNDEKRAFVNSVEHIGNYSSITPDVEDELKRRSINLRAATLPSLDANLTTSPAWVIMTPQGVHIAEGIIEISSLFNEYGEYDPKNYSNAESTVKAEGF
jgi:hypothetical protein